MKKVILSSIVAAAIATTATAGMKVGVGTDVLNGEQMLRISLDGLVENLRIEPRLAFASNKPATGSSTSGSAYGVGVAYNLSKTVAVGGHFDSVNMVDVGGKELTRFAGLIKAETDLGENFSIAFEIGIEQEANKDANTVTQPYQAVTMRAWF